MVPLKKEMHIGSYKKKKDTNNSILSEVGTFSKLESNSEVNKHSDNE